MLAGPSTSFSGLAVRAIFLTFLARCPASSHLLRTTRRRLVKLSTEVDMYISAALLGAPARPMRHSQCALRYHGLIWEWFAFLAAATRLSLSATASRRRIARSTFPMTYALYYLFFDLFYFYCGIPKSSGSRGSSIFRRMASEIPYKIRRALPMLSRTYAGFCEESYAGVRFLTAST